jgi:hypothetical protein
MRELIPGRCRFLMLVFLLCFATVFMYSRCCSIYVVLVCNLFRFFLNVPDMLLTWHVLRHHSRVNDIDLVSVLSFSIHVFIRHEFGLFLRACFVCFHFLVGSVLKHIQFWKDVSYVYYCSTFSYQINFRYFDFHFVLYSPKSQAVKKYTQN